MSPDEAKFISTFNMMVAFLIILVVPAFIVFFYVLNAYVQLFEVVIVFWGLLPLGFFLLNRQGCYHQARIYVLILLNIKPAINRQHPFPPPP